MENFPNPVNKQEQKEKIKTTEGIDFVFEQYPEIKKIAQEFLELSFEDKKAKEVYGKYLETIFPESQIKDIVYHGTKYNFDEFNKEYKGKGSGNDTNVDLGFYFAKDKVTAGIFTEGAYAHEATQLLEKLHKEGREEDRAHIINQIIGKEKPLFQKGVFAKYVATKDSKILPVLLNIKNPHTVGGSRFAETYDPKKNLEENQELTAELQTVLVESDGIIVDTEDPCTPFSEELNSDNFIVPSPEQIHILGSKKDQEMFKKFLRNKKI